MSDTTNVTKAPKATANLSDKELMALLEQYIKQGAQELTLELLMWKQDTNGKYPVIGHIVSINEMPPADRKENPNWKAFLIALTQDTYGTDRNKEIKKVKAGSEILVPANYELTTNLARFALDPDEVHELGIQALTKVDIGGGQSMWRHRVIVISSKKRTGRYALATPAAPKELGTGAAPGTFDPATGEVHEQPATSAAAS